MIATRGQRCTRRRAPENGFSLVELLIAVLVVGILLAIAIPLYLHYRHGAANRSLRSDIRGAVSAEEQCLSDQAGAAAPAYRAGDDAGSPGTDIVLTCVTGTPPVTETVAVSADNTLVITVTADPASYVVTGTNGETGATYTYTSATSTWS